MGPYLPLSTPFRSRLGASLQQYIATKQALGRRFVNETRVLLHWDAFLYQYERRSKTVSRDLFDRWAHSLERLNVNVQRHWLQIVRNFLLFHARQSCVGFIPDLTSFPHPSPPRPPRLVSESEMARILATATRLEPSAENPIRAQTVRMALLLLFCCGLRRGELLRLKLSHFDPDQELLRIEATKFNKSRLVPLAASVARELHNYLEERQQSCLPADKESFLFWRSQRTDSLTYSGQKLSHSWRQLCLTVGVLDEHGRPPRLHDLRYSFIAERLQQWYNAGVNVQNRLVHLSSYVGHVNPASTHYYVQFTPQIREAANQRFHQGVSVLFEEGGLQ